MIGSILSAVPNRVASLAGLAVCLVAALVVLSTCGDPEPASYAARAAIVR